MENRVCQNCREYLNEDDITCKSCGSNQTENDSKIYRDPTWPLRMTIFFAYFGIFMSLATLGVFLILIPPSIIFTLPIVLLEIWVARNLGKYNKLARYLLIVISLIIIITGIVIFSFDPGLPTPAGGAIFLIGSYSFYALILHRDTVELYSGKYRPEPDYTFFG